jgi:hypothetical protein
MKSRIGSSVLLLLLFGLFPFQTVAAQERATLVGIIYFTNNTPEEVEQFPIELFTSDRGRRVAKTKPDHAHRFKFSELKPRKYLLRVTWPGRCVLWYRVNLTTKSAFTGRLIMDVDCAHANGVVRGLEEQP